MDTIPVTDSLIPPSLVIPATMDPMMLHPLTYTGGTQNVGLMESSKRRQGLRP